MQIVYLRAKELQSGAEKFLLINAISLNLHNFKFSSSACKPTVFWPSTADTEWGSRISLPSCAELRRVWLFLPSHIRLDRTRLDWIPPWSVAVASTCTIRGKKKLMQTGRMPVMRAGGHLKRLLVFWAQQYPVQRGNKLCATQTQRRFPFCQHNSLCWVWKSPWMDTHTKHRVEFYYLSCRSAHICARVFVSVHIEWGGDMFHKMNAFSIEKEQTGTLGGILLFGQRRSINGSGRAGDWEAGWLNLRDFSA